MNVLFIGNDKSILTGENGDARLRHLEYAKHFDQLYIIIFSLKGDHLTLWKEKNLTIIPTNSQNRWFYLFDSLKIISRLGLIILISTQDPFLAGLTGVFAKWIWKIKLNIQVHNVFFSSPYFRWENFQNYVFYWLGKFCLLFADSVRVVNPHQKYGRNRFLAPVPVDLGYFWSEPHIKNYNQIICIARLAKQKNLPLLFDAAHALTDLKFVVIGEGEERKSLEKIKPDNVFLVGQKSREEVKNYLSRSDIFVLTSNYEGYAITVMEALASGIPVVMTDTGCARSLIIDNKIGGIVVPIGDKEKLVRAIKVLISNPKKSNELVSEGQKLLKREYNQKRLIQQFISGLKNTV